MLFSIIPNSFTPCLTTTAVPGSVWCFENTAVSQIHFIYYEKQWRKQRFNRVQYTMGFLKHGFCQTFKGLSLFRCTGNEMWHYEAPFQCNTIKWKTNIAHHNNCLYNLTFCDLSSGSFSTQFYLQRRLWSLPEDIDVNTNKTNKHFFNSCFFSPCSHSATFIVKTIF